MPRSVKFKLFHSLPESRQHIPKAKAIYSNKRATENKRLGYRKGRKEKRSGIYSYMHLWPKKMDTGFHFGSFVTC